MGVFDVYFLIFSLIALGCGVGVLTARHPLTGAVSLIGTMVSLAGIYALLGSPFLGVIQILVYAGAIMMLLVFVIMMLNCAKDDTPPGWDILRLIGVFIPLLFVLLILSIFTQLKLSPHAQALPGTIDDVSAVLFDFESSYWLLFLTVGLILLVALASAILLAKKDGPQSVEKPQ